MKKRLLNLSLFIWLLILGLLLFPTGSRAQTTLQIDENQALVDFPNTLTFEARATGPHEIQQAFLQYGTNSRTCLQSTVRQKVEFTASTEVQLEWVWRFKESGNLPPGAQVWWQWEVQDSAGNLTTSERQTITIEDNRYTWKQLSQGGITIFWVVGDQAFGQALLNMAQDGLDRLARNAGIEPLEQIRLTIYPSFEAVRSAALFLPEWTGGVAYPEFDCIILGVPPGYEDWAADSIPHEVAHLVSGVRTFNCLGVGLPTWLNEGLSVYAEGEADPQSLIALEAALEGGTLPSLRSLAAGFAANADRANLSYTYSGEVVRFLIETYGPEKMAALLDTIKSGQLIDPALTSVYGFDTDGLDRTWRAVQSGQEQAVSASATPDLNRTPTPEPSEVPTLALWTLAVSLPSETPTAQDTPTKTLIPATATFTPSATLPLPPSATATSQQEEPTPTAEPTQPSTSPLRCLGNLAGLALLVGLGWLSRYLPRRT